jgi:hypothetical protein
MLIAMLLELPLIMYQGVLILPLPVLLELLPGRPVPVQRPVLPRLPPMQVNLWLLPMLLRIEPSVPLPVLPVLPVQPPEPLPHKREPELN